MRSVCLTLAALGVCAAGPGTATSFTTLAAFTGSGDAAGPTASVTPVGGILYGAVTYGGAHGSGAIISIDPGSGAERVLYSFTGGADGGTPAGALVASGGKLYGVTAFGGTGNGAVGNGVLFAFDPASNTESVLHSFTGADGAFPEKSLIASGGSLFGVTEGGGAQNAGTVFAYTLATASLATLHNFAGGTADGATPTGPLLKAGTLLYGTTNGGGANGQGTLFSLNPVGGRETVLHSFVSATDGANPIGALLDVSGVLYGTASSGGANGGGTAFGYALKRAAFSTLHAFGGTNDGAAPEGGVIVAEGLLYGTTYGGGSGGEGTVYRLDPSTGTETVLQGFAFSTGPAFPQGELVLLGGMLYGTSEFGGAEQQGAVFVLNLGTNTLTDLYSFTGTTPQEGTGVVAARGGLDAFASNGGAAGLGTLVSVPLESGSTTKIFDWTNPAQGETPLAPPIILNGKLVGTTSSGGSTGCGGIGCGLVYSVDPDTGTETILHNFDSTGDGYLPYAPLVSVGGKLVGTTENGGSNFGSLGCYYGCGTVYSLDLKSGTEAILHDFMGSPDGAAPFTAGLTRLGKLLYGVTIGGGANNAGTIYDVDPVSGAETVLYSFDPGSVPYGGVTALGGQLYGTTGFGGANGGGSLFSYDPKHGVITTLHSFNGSDGYLPESSLLAVGTTLYGVTAYGGLAGIGCTNGCGTAFSYNVGTAAFSVLHAFAGGAEGGNVSDPLIAIGGTLYGATGSGGANGIGTVFSLVP